MDRLSGMDEVRVNLRKLLEAWKDDLANADYLGNVLPNLLKNPELSGTTERVLVEAILSGARDANLDDNDLASLAREEHFRMELSQIVIPDLERDLRNFQLSRAEERFNQYREVLQEDRYERRRSERIASRKRTIRYDISRLAFEDAKELSSDSKEVLRDDEALRLASWLEESIADAIGSFVDSRVLPFLRRYEFEKAQEVFQTVAQHARPGTFQTLLEKHRQEQAAIQEAAEISELLARQDFLGAQALFERSSTLTGGQFSQLMGSYVRTYFARSCGFPIDEYKARAMSTTSRRTLVEARAGSGKTTLLACFVKLLHEKLGIGLDEILVMAFNKTAAKGIGCQIDKKLGDESFANARTFHSLAWHLAEDCSWTKVLSDDPKREEHEQERRKFLEGIWKRQRASRPWLWVLALLMFRKEMAPKEAELNPDSENYYLYRRNECNQTSLRGENVKSLGEKIIADFLLEHDVPYAYERSYFWDRRLYHPDFTIFNGTRKPPILEHWGIDPTDPHAQVPAHWGKTTEQYRAEIVAKRDFWKREGHSLLETNASQVQLLGREGFENYLKELLQGSGYECRLLSREEIKERVSNKRTRKFVELLGQCISLAKKAKLSPEDVRGLYRNAKSTDPKIRAFGSIAWRIYRQYEKAMRKGRLTDYDSLLDLAANRVEEAQGALTVRDDTRGHFHLEKLKWVLLDEYQDFSSLFDGMLRAILKFNPSIRVLCVGDNWQAINGFAGSDTKHIDSFEELNRNDSSVRFVVPVNRRSGERIIDAGNLLMSGVPGNRAIPRKGAGAGTIDVCHVDDIYVELRKTREYQDRYEADAKYLVEIDKNGRVSTDALASKYLKLVTQIIEVNPRLSYSVLTRTNWLSSIDIRKFKVLLCSCLGGTFIEEMESHDGRIDVSTVHSYKGGESDVSIVLRVIDRQFPMVHPDSALLAPLGQTPERIISEERRLFYVAISRARERLILVTERDRESLFIEEITGRSFASRTYR